MEGAEADLEAADGTARAFRGPADQVAFGVQPAKRRVTVDRLGACRRLDYRTSVIKVENGQEKGFQFLRVTDPIYLPQREEPLVFVALALGLVTARRRLMPKAST